MKKNIPKLIGIIILFGIPLFIVACTPNMETEPKDENITTIETVLERTFTGPEQELKDIWSTIESDGIEDVESSLNAMNSYSKEKFKSYFTEDGYREYIASFGFTFLKAAYWNDYQLNAKNIKVERSEVDTIYDFSLEVEYQREGNDKKVAIVTGEANMNENGRIAVMLIGNEGLWEALQE